MLKENTENIRDRNPLFTGSNSVDWSPKLLNAVQENEIISTYITDQLSVIFSIIGTPNKEDMKFISNSKVVKVLESFSQKKHIDFKEIYPKSSPEALDFISKTVVFNPRKRIDIDECIRHPYFEKIRNLEKEVVFNLALNMDFESEDKLNEKRLREILIEEIRLYLKK